MRSVVVLLVVAACHVRVAQVADGARGDTSPDSTYAGASNDAVIRDASPVAHTYLIAILGQSNAEGVGDATDAALDPTLIAPYPIIYDATVFTYWNTPLGARGYADPSGGTMATYSYGYLQPFYYNVAHVDFGIELTLGRDLDAAFPGRVAVTKFAMGGSQLDTQWTPSARYPAVGPNLAHLALAHVRAAYEACGCDRLIVVWEQGEQDAQHLFDAQMYASRLTPLIALFRSVWPDSLWAIGRLNSDAVNATSPATPYVSVVQDQEAAYVASDPQSILVDQDAFPLRADHLHYMDQAYLDNGHAWAQAILSALPAN